MMTTAMIYYSKKATVHFGDKPISLVCLGKTKKALSQLPQVALVPLVSLGPGFAQGFLKHLL